MASALGDLVRLGRPHFLLGGVLFHLVGAARAGGIAAIDWTLFAACQAFVTLTQAMVHYANEAWDLDADRERGAPGAWTGGSGVLVRGTVQVRTSLRIARTLGVAAVVAAAGLAFLVPEAARVPVAAASAATWVLAWGYSAPPPSLARRGLGPATVGLVVGALVPLLGALTQGASPVAVLPVALLLFLLFGASIMVFDLADLPSDERAGKRTLAVRLGQAGAVRAARLLLILAAMWAPVVAFLEPAAGFALAAAAPLAGYLGWNLAAWADIGAWAPPTFAAAALPPAAGAASLLPYIV